MPPSSPTSTSPTPSPLAELSQRPLLTSIVATIGPASDTPEMVNRLIEAGVSVFRFNFSHGSLLDHARRLETVRDVSRGMGVTVACLGDLQGPKIRVGKIPESVGRPSPSGGGTIDVVVGQDVILKKGIDLAFMRPATPISPISPTTTPTFEPVLPLTYQPLVDEVEIGHKVLINDGAIRMLAISRDAAAGGEGGSELRCRVTAGGPISSGKGINLPQSRLSAPAITDRDWECAAWAVQNDMDFLALSFVRDAADVEALRAGLATMCAVGPTKDHRHTLGTADGAWIPIIAKVELPEAVANLDAIIAASDGIMVARGDLGVEMDIALVPVIQKQIVTLCREYGRPCIVATQMLESMIQSVNPTRAEATDVANAIFDGADAVMLSAETATGAHPIIVVETMARILNAAEAYIAAGPCTHTFPTKLTASHRGTAALAHGAWQIAQDLGAKAVVVWSENGGTARYLSQNRFHIPIIAYSSNPSSCRRMALLRGVTSICAPPPGSGSLSEWNESVDATLLAKGMVKDGDAIVLLAGRPLGQAKRTNTLAIHRVGEPTGYRNADLA